jgi:putative Mn2+ efflux pump MntP
MWNFLFFFESILLGVGLAMDAFSVSLANGLRERSMGKPKMAGVAGIFAIFQGIMPLIGWVCVHTLLVYFTAFQRFIPWIALALLGFIGAKMLTEGLRGECEECGACRIGFLGLAVQGIATSIDALSVGFTIAEYDFVKALVAALIISAVTFLICFAGLYIGKKAGNRLSGKATSAGGIILILIGIEIFVTGLIG